MHHQFVPGGLSTLGGRSGMGEGEADTLLQIALDELLPDGQILLRCQQSRGR